MIRKGVKAQVLRDISKNDRKPLIEARYRMNRLIFREAQALLDDAYEQHIQSIEERVASKPTLIARVAGKDKYTTTLPPRVPFATTDTHTFDIPRIDEAHLQNILESSVSSTCSSAESISLSLSISHDETVREDVETSWNCKRASNASEQLSDVSFSEQQHRFKDLEISNKKTISKDRLQEDVHHHQQQHQKKYNHETITDIPNPSRIDRGFGSFTLHNQQVNFSDDSYSSRNSSCSGGSLESCQGNDLRSSCNEYQYQSGQLYPHHRHSSSYSKHAMFQQRTPLVYPATHGKLATPTWIIPSDQPDAELIVEFAQE